MGIVDFHTHILPCVDDGSASLEESIAMLRCEAEQGVSKVVLTPHFYANHDSPERFLSRRQRAVEQLTEAMADENGLPALLVGAEVHFFDGISDSEYLSRLAIGNTGCVMVEMPMRDWSDRMLYELEGIRQKQGLTPIIAHLDRYIQPFATHGLPERLAQLPVAVQANGSFFIHRSTRGLAIKLLRQGKLHLLGSDCHDLKKRPPNLGDALQVIRHKLGEDGVSYIHSQESKLIG